MKYFSTSKNSEIEIANMNRFHLANAIKKMIKLQDHIVVDTALLDEMVFILELKNDEAIMLGEEVAEI